MPRKDKNSVSENEDVVLTERQIQSLNEALNNVVLNNIDDWETSMDSGLDFTIFKNHASQFTRVWKKKHLLLADKVSPEKDKEKEVYRILDKETRLDFEEQKEKALDAEVKISCRKLDLKKVMITSIERDEDGNIVRDKDGNPQKIHEKFPPFIYAGLMPISK